MPCIRMVDQSTNIVAGRCLLFNHLEFDTTVTLVGLVNRYLVLLQITAAPYITVRPEGLCDDT